MRSPARPVSRKLLDFGRPDHGPCQQVGTLDAFVDEYHVEEYPVEATFGAATLAEGSHVEAPLRYPKTAPNLNQTVFVVPAK